MVFAIHRHESATGVHVSPILNPAPTSLPTIPLGNPRTLALSALLHASNLHWSSVLHMVTTCFSAILSNYPTLAFSQRVQSLLFTSVSLLLPCIQDHCYHLYKFHIYALIYVVCILYIHINIQREVSQKEKHQYSILMHTYEIQNGGSDDPICKTAKETQI